MTVHAPSRPSRRATPRTGHDSPAFARLQTTTAASAGIAMTLAHAFPAPVTVGSSLLVVVMAPVTPFDVTVADDRGNRYTRVAAFGPGTVAPESMSVWECLHAFGGATTVTITTTTGAAFVGHYLEFVGPLGLPVETAEQSGTATTGFRQDRFYPSAAPYFAFVLGLAVGASGLTLWGTPLTEQNQPPDALTALTTTPIALLYTIWAADSGPTGAVDTTTATLIVVCIPYSNVGSPTLVISDSKGNAWRPLTSYGAPGSARIRFYYCLNPIVGMGHTFTVSGTNTPIIIFSFTGVKAYQTENGTGYTGTPTPPKSPGSVTPVADGALILTGLATTDPQGFFTDSLPGFPLTTGITDGIQGSVGFYVQPTAAPINPSWAWTGSRSDIALTTAVFLPVNAAVPDAYRTKTANPTTLAP